MHSPLRGIGEKKSDKSPAEELAAYSLTEASRYLLIPRVTLRSWVARRNYPTDSGPKFFRPIIELPDEARAGLSFVNLVEAHVLDAIRRHHQVPLRVPLVTHCNLLFSQSLQIA